MNYVFTLTQRRSRPKLRLLYWTYYEYVAASSKKSEDVLHLSNAKLVSLNVENRLKSLKLGALSQYSYI